MKRTKIDDLIKKVPFQVPDGYFERLTVDIQAKIAANPQRQWVSSPQLRWVLTSAATAVLVASLWVFNSRIEHETTADELLAEVNEQALLDYLDMTDLSDAELLDGLSEEELKQLWTDEDLLEELELESETLDDLIEAYETEENLL